MEKWRKNERKKKKKKKKRTKFKKRRGSFNRIEIADDVQPENPNL